MTFSHTFYKTATYYTQYFSYKHSRSFNRNIRRGRFRPRPIKCSFKIKAIKPGMPALFSTFYPKTLRTNALFLCTLVCLGNHPNYDHTNDKLIRARATAKWFAILKSSRRRFLGFTILYIYHAERRYRLGPGNYL